MLPADGRVFLGRLTHLDPAAVVRLRASAPDRVALWGRLPWGTLVTREVAASVPDTDLTVAAAALLAERDDWPERCDARWRWPLPPRPGDVVEEIPSAEIREVAAAAATTLRELSTTGLNGRAVGARRVREALLDHVAIVVETATATRLEVPQRLIQAVVRMGFLGPAGTPDPVRVRQAGAWVGLAARYGTAWLAPPGPLTLRPVSPGYSS